MHPPLVVHTSLHTALPSVHTSLFRRVCSGRREACHLVAGAGPLGYLAIATGGLAVSPIHYVGWCGTPLGHLAIAHTPSDHTSLLTALPSEHTSLF